jgi:S1-C subfamily serine protease
MGKQEKKAYRTTMPEILYPGTGLSGAGPKSQMPFNNVHTIWDVLTGKKYQLPGAQGDWGDWSRDERAQPGSYKDNADLYKRRERDMDIMRNLANNSLEGREVWKLKVEGGYKEFPSLEAAQKYRRKMQEKGIFVSWITKKAQKTHDEGHVDDALNKTFLIESQNFQTNTQETGSAFCVSPGYFLTCAHVIKNYNKNTESNLDFSKYEDMIKVLITVGNKKVDATVVAFDGALDLALLKADVDAEPFEFDPFISIGEEIFAVGSPHGFENNVTFGHVSSTDRKIYYHRGAPYYMFVDLAILPGNSGGPIINRNTGKVIGVVTAIVGEGDDYGLNAGVLSHYAVDFCKENGIQVKS